MAIYVNSPTPPVLVEYTARNAKTIIRDLSVRDKVQANFLKSNEILDGSFNPVRFQSDEMISLKIEMDQYDGSSNGTVAEFFDGEDRRLSIGFANGFNTFYRASPQLLQIISKNSDDIETIKSLGKPNKNSHSYYLFTIKDVLLAFDGKSIFQHADDKWHKLGRTDFLSLLVKHNFTTDSQRDRLDVDWFCHDGENFQCINQLDVFGADIRIGSYYLSDKQVLFSPEYSAQIQETYPVLRSFDLDPIYYWSNRIIFLFKNSMSNDGAENGIGSCMLSNGKLNLESCNFVQISANENLHSYAIGGNKTELIINLNDGHSLVISKDNDIRILRKANGRSFQIYAYINLDNRHLLGEYPFGDLMVYEAQKLSVVTPRIPIDDYRLSSRPELQSLSVYDSHLYAGLWPWGQLWKTDGRKWILANRFFSTPDINDIEYGPYEFLLKEKAISPINLLGQRITSIIPFGNDLIISTGAKNHGANHKDLPISEDELSEFGQIYSLNLPGNFAYDIGLNTKFNLELVARKTLNDTDIFIDGKKVGSLGSYIDPRSFTQYRANNGLFGKLNGSVTLANGLVPNS